MGGSVLTHTLTVCPDPICQNKTDIEIANNKARAKLYEQEKQERLKAQRNNQNNIETKKKL